MFLIVSEQVAKDVSRKRGRLREELALGPTDPRV